MSPFQRRPAGVAARRPHAGLLRRERRELQRSRGQALQELGGLLVEMYRRGELREDLLYERCAAVVGIDDRLGEIDDLLHPRRQVPQCDCGVPILRGSHFCPNCGRAFEPADTSATRIEPTHAEEL